MIANLYTMLMAGEYICAVRYPAEHTFLQDEDNKQKAQDYLDTIDMRLAQMNDNGAFFMATKDMKAKEQARFKADAARFRDLYGAEVAIIEYIRGSGNPAILVPGEIIAIWELEQAISTSTMAAAKLRGMTSIIHKAGSKNSDQENLKRMLEHLAKEGYLTVASKELSTYKVTGKIEHLHQAMVTLKERGVLPDLEVDDTSESGNLFDGDPVDEDPEDDTADDEAAQ